MSNNKGKQFEKKFQEDWLKTFPQSFILRLADQMTGYKVTSQNPCDFIGYKKPVLFLIECKSHEGNTFPLSNLTQYEKLLAKAGIPGVRSGVIIWFIDHDRVVYVPVKTIEKMKADGKKSVNIRTINKDGYRFFEIPSVKKRVFMDSDYSILESMEDGD